MVLDHPSVFLINAEGFIIIDNSFRLCYNVKKHAAACGG
jgi:hypothetical protein